MDLQWTSRAPHPSSGWVGQWEASLTLGVGGDGGEGVILLAHALLACLIDCVFTEVTVPDGLWVAGTLPPWSYSPQGC